MKLCFVFLLSATVLALPVKKGEHFKIPVEGEYIVHGSFNKAKTSFQKRIGPQVYLVKSTDKNFAKAKNVSPNYAYYGNYMESTNDEFFEKQKHHTILQTEAAWAVTKGSSDIIIAVTDNEFEMDHQDLVHAWWINEGEIAGNGIDDDGNGYIDDVNGWDFIGQDNDMDVPFTPYEYSEGTHGTHVAGTIAAQANNKIGVAGVAPGVKVMPLRWYGRDISERRWTSAVIAETYYYAVDNGANIISTSYNIDKVVDDKAYIDAVNHAVRNNVLVFNSAGNDRKKNPPRQKNEDIILVCSVKIKRWWGGEDRRSWFTNYGTGIDICAPGDPIYATVQGRDRDGQSRYGELSGTSMATPIAAAAAALIWSVNPNFSAEEVRSKLLESVDDIYERSPRRYQGMLGSGRVNLLKAVQ